MFAWVLTTLVAAQAGEAFAPLPPAQPPPAVPMMEGTPVVSAAPVRPVPPRRPWWALGVSERAYRVVLPQGPSHGELSAEDTAGFWRNYALARRESVLLDAAELGALAVPAVFLLAAAAAVPLVALTPLAERSGVRGTAVQRLVAAAFVLTPFASLGTVAVGAVCGLVFTGLSTLDAQDNGSPQAPVRETPAGRAAVAAGAAGHWSQVALAGALVAVAVPASAVAFVVPWVAPFALGALAGATPLEVARGYRGALAANGILFGSGAVGAFLAVCALTGGIPLVLAAGYLMQVLPGVLGWQEGEDTGATADDRDLSSFTPWAVWRRLNQPQEPSH